MSGLFRNDPSMREGKYPVLLRRDGTVPEWEWFVLGERDPAAPAAIEAYAAEAERLGFDPKYVTDLRNMASSWIAAQMLEAHDREQRKRQDKPADPDGARHRKDDPDVLNFPGSLAAFKAQADRAGRRRLLAKVAEMFWPDDPETDAYAEAALRTELE